MYLSGLNSSASSPQISGMRLTLLIADVRLWASSLPAQLTDDKLGALLNAHLADHLAVAALHRRAERNDSVDRGRADDLEQRGVEAEELADKVVEVGEAVERVASCQRVQLMCIDLHAGLVVRDRETLGTQLLLNVGAVDEVERRPCQSRGGGLVTSEHLRVSIW